MRLLLFAALLAGTPVAAQRPSIGIVDVYGARTLTSQQVRLAADIRVGDAVADNLEQIVQQRLQALPNVAEAQVAVICCANGESIVYLGVRERSDSALVFTRPPAGDALLPPNILNAEQRFHNALQEAVQRGEAEEDDSLGHSLMRYAAAREVQQEFITYALGNVGVLRDVLRTARDARQRALAAQIIAYAVNKSAVIADLVDAVRDSDANVRNNAMRALGVIAGYAERHPETGWRVPAEPFIALLNSPHWTDRNKASFVLMSLTSTRHPVLLQQMRRNALPALIDMIYWQHEGHALPAALILGRMGGIPDDAIMAAFKQDRNVLIEAARNPL